MYLWKSAPFWKWVWRWITKKQGDKGSIAIISSAVEKLQNVEFNGEYTIIDPKKLLDDTIREIETSIMGNGAVLIPGILSRFPESSEMSKGTKRKNL